MERVQIANVDGAYPLAEQLTSLGCVATVYQAPFGLDRIQEGSQRGVVQVGGSVSVATAVRVLQASFRHWPTLRHVRLSCDSGNSPPEQEHYQIFVGAINDGLDERGFRPWSTAHVARLTEDLPLPLFHAIVRSFYPRHSGAAEATAVQWYGGMCDGEKQLLPGTQQWLFATFPTWAARDMKAKQEYLYELRETDTGLGYHLVKVTPFSA